MNQGPPPPTPGFSLSPDAFQAASIRPAFAPAPSLAPAPLVPSVPSRVDGRAVGALVLGVASMTCLGFLAGIPALVMGAMARREIDRSQGALTGGGLAAGAIATGLFGTGISVVAIIMLLSSAIQGDSSSSSSSSAHHDTPHAAPIAAGTHSYGPLDVVDLDEHRALQTQLVEISRSASAKKRTVMLQTYVRTSKECMEVAAALPDKQMQRALSNVTLVRVDIESFEDSLRSMRIETESAPWFYKLDANGRPTDAISADEWDANIPENMAPILKDFAQGSLSSRRSPSPMGTAL